MSPFSSYCKIFVDERKPNLYQGGAAVYVQPRSINFHRIANLKGIIWPNRLLITVFDRSLKLLGFLVLAGI